MGARDARDQVLELADRLQAPMVLTLKAKEGLERDNPFQVGQSGLIGNPAAAKAMDDCDVLFLVGTDFPYRDWYPAGKTVVQLDARQAHIGRRTSVAHALVGDVGDTLRALLPKLTPRPDGAHLDAGGGGVRRVARPPAALLDPRHDDTLIGKVRAVFDNPDDRIRPEALAAALDGHAAADAIFTTDTGMSTVWLSRFVTMTDRRRLIGSYNLGSMANAMPQALGAQALDRGRQVVALCGDGGLMMLLGDLRTAVTYGLPVKLSSSTTAGSAWSSSSRSRAGCPSSAPSSTTPTWPRSHWRSASTPAGSPSRSTLDDAVAWALAHDGPVLLDVVTNPEEVSVPPKPTLAQGWGFAIAKSKEALESR